MKNPENANEEIGQSRCKAKSPVEYYVHYLEQERPNDRWVKENMVKIDDEVVENLLEES